MTEYNGHKNWNHWNVALWIGNDEYLYRMALRHIEGAVKYNRGARLDVAAERFLGELGEMRITKTPDGAPYTKTTVKAAIRGISEGK